MLLMNCVRIWVSSTMYDCTVHDVTTMNPLNASTDVILLKTLLQRTSETFDKAALLINYLKLIKIATVVSF